jgi:hypothetical protein
MDAIHQRGVITASFSPACRTIIPSGARSVGGLLTAAVAMILSAQSRIELIAPMPAARSFGNAYLATERSRPSVAQAVPK